MGWLVTVIETDPLGRLPANPHFYPLHAKWFEGARVMRKQTGLRNKFRSGRSTYCVKNKSVRADRYGTYNQGRLMTAENVAGHSISKPLPGMDNR